MKLQHLIWAGSIGLAAVAVQACSDDSSPGTGSGSGGAKTGGSNSGASGGGKTGGSNSGGATTGGVSGMAGATTGGVSGMAGEGSQAGASGAPGGGVDAFATVLPKVPSTLAGIATFKGVGGGDVKLKLDLVNCPQGEHALHLHANSTCAAPGGHWIPNGEGIANITCDAGMTGTLNFSANAATWEVNTGGTNDVTKYTIVIHADPGGGTPLACGEIDAATN